MGAITKKEIRACFRSPIAYVCIGVLLAVAGYYYAQVLMIGSSSNIPAVYSILFNINMILIPILTMRSLSEERKNKTDQALLTAPVSTWSIAVGKFVAPFLIYAIGMAITLVPAVVITFIGSPNWALIFGDLLGALFYGAAMVAIGIFISSCTENQIVAAVGTLGISLVLMFMDQIGSILNNDTVTKVLGWISFNTRYQKFTSGTFDIPSVVFFVSVAVIFLFLTSRRLEARRWK